MLSSNPTLNNDTFRNQAIDVYDAEQRDVMTMQGAVNKTLILLAICVWPTEVPTGTSPRPHRRNRTGRGPDRRGRRSTRSRRMSG